MEGGEKRLDGGIIIIFFLVKLTGCPRHRESTQILRSGRLLGEPVLEGKQESQFGTC